MLKNGLSKVCLSGEGKGRFYTEGERQTFSFESLLDTKNKKLNISYHFPFHGEEGLSIIYKDALKGAVAYQGSLFDRIKSEDLKGGSGGLRGFFSPYVTKLGHFLFFFNSFKEAKHFDSSIRCGKASREKGVVRGECVYGADGKSFDWETSVNHFSFYFNLSNHRGVLRLRFDREKEKFFSKWTTSFDAHDYMGIPLKIEKYMSLCDVSPKS